MEETNGTETGETIVAVGLTGGRKCKYLLRWALDKFQSEGNVSFKLLHVYPKITEVATPMGGWLPIRDVHEDAAAGYRWGVQMKKKKMFLPYEEAMKPRKVKSEIVLLESDDIAMAISLEIAKHSIRHLVIGFSSNSIFSRKNLSLKKLMGGNLSTIISESAPSFCSVYVVADMKLQHMRPAESVPTEISIDDISGLSNILIDSTPGSSLTIGHLLKSGPSSPRHPGSAASDSFPINTQHKEHEPLPRRYSDNTNIISGYSRALNQSSSSSDSWMSEQASPGGSFVGAPPQRLSPMGSFLGMSSGGPLVGTPPSGSFMDRLPIGSSVGTPPKDTFPGTYVEAPPKSSPMGTPTKVTFIENSPAGSFVQAPAKSPPMGTPPKVTFTATHRTSFIDAPPKSSVVTPPQHQPTVGPPTDAVPRQVSELEKLRIELRHLEQMYQLAQKNDINEKFIFPLDELTDLSKQRVEEAVKLKEQKAKELASLQQIKQKAAQGEAAVPRDHDLTDTLLSKAETKAANEAKENEEKLKQLITGFICQYQKFTWKEIVEATSSFSDEFKIGMGAFGTVYKCKLHHTNVAVKVLHSKNSATNKQFLQELEILSTIRHPHLLLLLGAVPEQSCLVYEYMDNGSLDDRLFRKNDTPPLLWYDRFRICWEVAAALAFLHGTKPRPIIHRDLKPANILLDHNVVSKIGDAGLGTMINVEPSNKSLKTLYKETSPVGTLCYIDPEYQRTGRVSTKSDIYALGVVILQLLTAKPAVGIAYVIEDAIDEGHLKEVLDTEAGQWPEKETLEMALLGLQCAELRGRDRPDLIEKVLPALERLKEVADRARESASSASTAPPAHFICPIRKDLMDDPYVAADGYTYDREAIEEWLADNNASPTTNLPLPHKFIMPNTSLLEAINQWKSRSPGK